jgi:peptidoglycan/xylan/chitin deacetylase (PgdA/CDA1 family)
MSEKEAIRMKQKIMMVFFSILTCVMVAIPVIKVHASDVTLNSWQCNNHSSDLNIWTGGVGGWNVGDYIEFNNVNLSGQTYMNFNLASASNGSFKIVTDSYSGTQIGTLNYNSTGSWDNYYNQACNLNGASGTHNLYIICASGAANVGTMTLGGSGTGGGGSNGNVYLTFDDGPSNSNSQTLINTLKSNGVNAATFFVIGQNISSNQTGWNAYKTSGFSLQNHSYTHQHMTSWSYQQVYNDLNQCNQAIQNGGAPKPTRIRLPYLESNSTIQSACSALGLTVVSPTVDSQDWNNASQAQIISNVSSLQAGGNPLMHDWPANTIAALPTIIQNLKSRGLGFAQY